MNIIFNSNLKFDIQNQLEFNKKIQNKWERKPPLPEQLLLKSQQLPRSRPLRRPQIQILKNSNQIQRSLEALIQKNKHPHVFTQNGVALLLRTVQNQFPIQVSAQK